jgi:hypothetical protein
MAIGFIFIKIESFTEAQSPIGSSVVRKAHTPPFKTSVELIL